MMSLLRWQGSALPYSVPLKTGGSSVPGTRMRPLSPHLYSSCHVLGPWWPGHVALLRRLCRLFPHLEDVLICCSCFELESQSKTNFILIQMESLEQRIEAVDSLPVSFNSVTSHLKLITCAQIPPWEPGLPPWQMKEQVNLLCCS